MTCRECGAPLTAGARWCRVCGEVIDRQACPQVRFLERGRWRYGLLVEPGVVVSRGKRIRIGEVTSVGGGS